MLGRKSIIWQLFGWYMYYPFFVVATEVSVASANVGVPLRRVNTLLMNIHVSSARTNVATALKCVSKGFQQLIPFQANWSSEKATPPFTLFKRGSTTVVGFLSSSLTHLQMSNCSHIFNIPWMSKIIPHLHSAHYGDCFAPSYIPPTPSAWCMVVTIC